MAKAAVPAGSRFKGYESYLVRDLVLQPLATRFRRERWVTPDGRTVVAPLSPGQVTVPRLVALLEAIGIKVSKRRWCAS